MRKSKKHLFLDDNNRKVYENDYVKINIIGDCSIKLYDKKFKVVKIGHNIYFDLDGAFWRFANPKIEKCLND